MTEDHSRWIDQAVAASRAKHYDEARELALRVLREDGTNVKALWVVASVTASINERRNALNQLLRLQPDNIAARQMLDSTEMRHMPVSSERISAISATSNSASQPVFLYAAVASLVLILVSTVSAAVIF